MKGTRMLENYPEANHLKSCIGKKFPYFIGIFHRQYSKFGDIWANAFNKEFGLTAWRLKDSLDERLNKS